MELQQYEMESARLRFRRLRADDFSLVAPILQDAQTMYAWEHAFTYEEVIDWIADMLRRYREDGCGYFVGLDRETGELAALAGPLAEQMEDGQPAIGLGWIVRRDRWGQGLGVECARAAIEFAFDKLDAPQVVATIRPSNIPSLRVAAACGMQPVGQLVKRYRDKEMPHVICLLSRDTGLPDAPAPDSAEPEPS